MKEYEGEGKRGKGLAQDGLVLTSSSEVTREALAQALFVVTDASTRAVSAFFVAFTKKDIAARRAFL